MSHPRMLDVTRSALIVIDVQEGYRGKTVDHEQMVRNVRTLVEAARVMQVPTLATEQYPKGLGHTQPEVGEGFPPEMEITEKRSMSCLAQPEFARRVRELDREQIVVCGIEAHACVSQTAHEMMNAGYQVHVAYDAVSARRETDRRVAWEKLIGSGIVPTTVETVCLEWVRTADAPEFKSIHALIK